MFYVQFFGMHGWILPCRSDKNLKEWHRHVNLSRLRLKKKGFLSRSVFFVVEIFKDKGVKMVQKCSEKRQRGFIQLVIETFKRSKVEIVCNIFSSKFTLFAPSPKVRLMIDMLIADLPQQWAWWGWYLTCWLLTTVREVLLTSPASIRSRRPTCSQSESSADLGLYAFKRINQLGNSSQDTKILFLYRGLKQN